MTCCLIPFVIVFGFIIPRRRVKASSPTFLIIIILSCLLGYISEYSWYGRPHPVACGFRSWLLGLVVVSLVSALNAKTWRLWRIFKTSFKEGAYHRSAIDREVMIMVIPAVPILIIWTIRSTPTAKMQEKGDDRVHYVCVCVCVPQEGSQASQEEDSVLLHSDDTRRWCCSLRRFW